MAKQQAPTLPFSVQVGVSLRLLSPTEEASRLERDQWGFESLRRHNAKMSEMQVP